MATSGAASAGGGDAAATSTGASASAALPFMETSLVAVRAAVYCYESLNASWVPADGGLSRVDLFSVTAAPTATPASTGAAGAAAAAAPSTPTPTVATAAPAVAAPATSSAAAGAAPSASGAGAAQASAAAGAATAVVSTGTPSAQAAAAAAESAFRVVAISANTSDVVINSALAKDMTYNKASNTFHHWTDAKCSYGLNFASLEEANTFAQAFETALKQLQHARGGHSQHRSAASRASTVNDSDSVDIPPPPSEKPATPSASLKPKKPDEGSLQADLKQKVLERKTSDTGRTFVTQAELDMLKTELEASFRRELDAAKHDILDAIAAFSKS
eukprot:TRINITY_DN4989_c0_g2_i1.p1 TRINITY_DN4989_c0_g2~~TRINITY_DN4989_c0_g2_i1.p1  ORF type:complete len:332 (-),score=96.02 TRINITY_DN4989_c0_g2_i1:972-1967(-)